MEAEEEAVHPVAGDDGDGGKRRVVERAVAGLPELEVPAVVVGDLVVLNVEHVGPDACVWSATNLTRRPTRERG